MVCRELQASMEPLAHKDSKGTPVFKVPLVALVHRAILDLSVRKVSRALASKVHKVRLDTLVFKVLLAPLVALVHRVFKVPLGPKARRAFKVRLVLLVQDRLACRVHRVLPGLKV